MISINNISFSYGEDFVLKDLSLEIQEGHVHGILGVNGAGKTTLFKLMTKQLSPVSGEISNMGQAIDRRAISYLETHNYFYPFIKGQEYLNILNEHETDIAPWNELFNLPLEELVENYSTGMKKKLAFMGALLQGKDILILDEPFNGVDIESNEKLFEIIKSLARNGKTVFISSHILSSLTNLCDRISVLENGAIQKTYTSSEFNSLQHKMSAEAKDSISNIMDDLINNHLKPS